MSRVTGLRWSRRTGHQAWTALRLCAALWMVFHIAYTPIHLYLEPHSDGSNVSTDEGFSHNDGWVAGDTHDGDDHPERHPAAQHKIKVTQLTRVVGAELIPMQAVEWASPHEDRSQPTVVGFSGLSPPEFLCAWQFIIRAAPPIRAPSLFS